MIIICTHEEVPETGTRYKSKSKPKSNFKAKAELYRSIITVSETCVPVNDKHDEIKLKVVEVLLHNFAEFDSKESDVKDELHASTITVSKT